MKHVCVIVPCYNEAGGLLEFHRRLDSTMQAQAVSWNVLYVDDGSQDGTRPLLELLRLQHPAVGVLYLSRNFGKEAALTAGLDRSGGDAVIVIDADLQDPPEVIADLLAAWQDGIDVVFARRRVRAGETWMKRATAHCFYRLMKSVGQVSLPPDTGDFRLMSRRAVDALLRLRERHRFMKGLFAWIGFPSRVVLYDRAARRSGRSSWTYWRLWNLAIEGITGYTVMPLKVAAYLGTLIAILALAYGSMIIVKTLVSGSDVPGYPSLMVVVLFLGGVQLITLGVIGEYLGRIFNETKQRPIYLEERFHPPATPGSGEAPWTYPMPYARRQASGASEPVYL